MMNEPYQMRAPFLVEEDLFGIDYLATSHPQVLPHDLVIAQNSAIMEFDKR